MLQPARTKFRKAHKGRIRGLSTSAKDLAFGQYGLKATEPERVTARQIEAARRALTRHMKRAGRVWIRIFPDVPVSKKPIEVRMGKGKGTPELWVARGKRRLNCSFLSFISSSESWSGVIARASPAFMTISPTRRCAGRSAS